MRSHWVINKFMQVSTWCFIHKAQLWDVSFRNFLVCYTHNFVIKFLCLNVKPGMQWYKVNENIRQKIPLSVLFLGLKYGKNLRFSLCEHCE
jgi:hypothetical protein